LSVMAGDHHGHQPQRHGTTRGHDQDQFRLSGIAPRTPPDLDRNSIRSGIESHPFGLVPGNMVVTFPDGTRITV
jgi:hypothetical protein